MLNYIIYVNVYSDSAVSFNVNDAISSSINGGSFKKSAYDCFFSILEERKRERGEKERKKESTFYSIIIIIKILISVHIHKSIHRKLYRSNCCTLYLFLIFKML